MHTLWVREHNRIATQLAYLNPGYTSGKLFLTTREIVSAVIQKITYKDYLPEILGDEISTLIPPYVSGDVNLGYNPEVDPSVPNAFATAAYRFGHSQIQPFFDRLDPSYNSIERLELNDAFFNTAPVRDFGIGSLFRGLVTTNTRLVDEFLNSVLTNNLFAEDSDTPGLDLASLNIQRGRDHGLPSYFVYRQWAEKTCGLVSDFRHELTEVHFLQVYGDLQNVDLFVGGLAEEPLPGGVVGATFACIFAQTFLALRHGDRFYYENQDGGAFSAAQIAEIEKATLSRVICDNTDTITIQENAFLAGQPRVDCDSLPFINLDVFQDQSTSGEPGTCFVKFNTDNSATYTAVSLKQTGPNRIRFHSDDVEGNSGCFPIHCPADSTETTNFAIFPAPGSPRSCTIYHESGLPSSVSSASYIYHVQNVPFATFVPANGIYATESSCESGSVAAVTFSCGSQKSTAKTQTVDTTGDEDEIRNVANDDDVMDEILGDGTVSKQEHLVSLMEEVLQTLQAQTSSKKSEETAMKAEKEKENAKLVSELEKLLQKK